MGFIRPPAHAVVAGPERGAAHHRELRHRRVGHRLDHLGAVLDHAGALVGLADHVAGGVLQIDDRRAALAAGLDEVGRLVGAVGIDRAVVADDADRVTLQRGMRRHRGRAVQRLEFEEVRVIDQARDDFAHVHRLAAIGRHDAEQFLRIETRTAGHAGRRHGRGREMAGPVQALHHFTCQPDTVGIVLGHVLAEAGHRGVHLGTAQVFLGRDLAGGGQQQRRSGEEGTRPAPHHDHVVRQARHVGAAGRRRTVHHGDHGQPGGRHARQVAEHGATGNEALDLVAQQVGAGALHQMHERQLVLQCDVLGPQDLLQCHGTEGTGLDAGVGGHHHAARPAHHADAGHDAGARHALRKVRMVLAVARQRRQFQVGTAGIEQQGDAVARQQLPAFVEQRLRLGRAVAGALLQCAHLGQQAQHVVPVGGEGFALRMDAGIEHGRHQMAGTT